MKDNKISKTALILVGNFLGKDYERSELYNLILAMNSEREACNACMYIRRN